jgi:membrane associated rhomboid family serine protease
VIGASGAISILFGYLFYYHYARWKEDAIFFGLFNLFAYAAECGISWESHVIGFILGYIIALLFLKKKYGRTTLK